MPPRGGGESDWMPKRVYFPPDPPPLGAQMNVDPLRNRTTGVPRELAAFANESFYAPLSTCLADFSPRMAARFRSRIDAYRKDRDELLTELRAEVSRLAGTPAETRAAEFAALAGRQAKALEKLEAEADALRAGLADKVSWFDMRQWKLGAGPLADRRPEHQYLEFQVVRAAAFYQPGLAPAQRPLLREAAMLLQDEMFVRRDDSQETPPAPAPVAAPRLMFFSPALVRMMPVNGVPADLAARFDAWVAEKDALRAELAAKVIAEDKAKFMSSRTRALEKLAHEQAPKLAALEVRAEELRREFAPYFERGRLPRPYQLPAEVLALIVDFEQRIGRMLERLDARQMYASWSTMAQYRGNDRGELMHLQMEARTEVTARFVEEHQPEFKQLEQELEDLRTILTGLVGEAELHKYGGGSDAFLGLFMAHYRQQWAYYEYEIAAFEPGLSPAQRRLLIGGAIRGLNLPLPKGERQPTELLRTFLDDDLREAAGLPPR